MSRDCATGRLAGKTVIVTAAAGAGLGQATARRFAAEGADIVLTDAHPRRTQEAAAALRAECGRDVLAMTVDVRRRADIEACVAATLERHGRIDVLVNNAGINRNGNVWELSDEDWDETLDVCLNGSFRFTRAVLPSMMERRRGVILNVTSIAGWTAKLNGPGQAAYAAAKAAVMALTRATAAECGSHGVRVNAIAPGLFNNPFLARTFAPEWLQSRAADSVLGRVGEPEDFTGAALFLCSDEAAFITGEALGVSGGWYMHP
ncbi:MAG: 3-oxoacyl-[acyl-carrier protein] reductase [Ramlibacter sp.]|nr:3-oxoacyl-[acyl-carrier protein] reductase [Ramlibacter sp.]